MVLFCAGALDETPETPCVVVVLRSCPESGVTTRMRLVVPRPEERDENRCLPVVAPGGGVGLLELESLRERLLHDGDPDVRRESVLAGVRSPVEQGLEAAECPRTERRHDLAVGVGAALAAHAERVALQVHLGLGLVADACREVRGPWAEQEWELGDARLALIVRAQVDAGARVDIVHHLGEPPVVDDDTSLGAVDLDAECREAEGVLEGTGNTFKLELHCLLFHARSTSPSLLRSVVRSRGSVV